MDVILNINNLNFQDIFQNITLSLEKNKIITVSGSNNSGKTTLCRILDRKIKGNFNINLMGKNIDEYSLEKYNHLIQVVYPNEFHSLSNYPLEVIDMIECPTAKMDYIKEELKRLKIDDKNIDKYNTKEKIWLQIMTAILKSNEIIIIDNLDYYLNARELQEVYEFIKRCIKKFHHSFIMTTTSLERSVDTDALYIIQNGEIVLHGEPLTILQHDNIINKAGLNVPFIIDLSVKLRDYDLIKKIELKKERLIDTIWN